MPASKFLLAILSALTFGSCTWGNLLTGGGTSERRFQDFIMRDTIDSSVRDEVAKNPPNGYLTKPYHPSQWKDYWNSRIFHIGSNIDPRSENGRANREWIRYIITSRQNADLPKLSVEPRNREIIRRAMEHQPEQLLIHL